MPGASTDKSASIVNVPNTLCAIRLFGSLALFYVALVNNSQAFVYGYVILMFTDCIDGKLAILLDQRTEFGARLDSVADATMYTALLFGMGWLKWDFIVANWPWFLVAMASYWLTSLTGLIKFRRIPSYHTYAAKTSAYFVFFAVVCLFTDWPDWPFYVAVVAVTLTNLEATLMTLVLPDWTADLRSVFHAVKHRSRAS
jgi:CDP-diacylglycerol--glycerol-3-phosphate 3-phosphatidyltransferase